MEGRGKKITVRPGRSLCVYHSEPASPSDDVLFLVHGGGGRAEQWRFQMEHVTSEAFQARRPCHVVAFDMLGHGDSDKPDVWEMYAMEEMLADVRAVVERFARDGGRRDMLAHSFGTACAVLLVSRGELDVDSLVLVGCGVVLPPGAAHVIWRLPVAVLNLVRPLMAGPARAMWHPSTDKALVDYEMTCGSRNPMHVMRPLLRQMEWPDVAAYERVRARNVPCLLITGAADPTTPVAGAEQAAAVLGTTLHNVADASHNVHLERAAAVNALIEPFLCGGEM